MIIKGKLISYYTVRGNRERHRTARWYGNSKIEHFKSVEEKIENLKYMHKKYDNEEMVDITITDEEFEIAFI